jgi:Asp-tRNA(Asn)/Glu-tRNA(Gln) amidotransferase A subunit family amidase
MQFIGKAFSEGVLLHAADIWQQATAYHKKRPGRHGGAGRNPAAHA